MGKENIMEIPASDLLARSRTLSRRAETMTCETCEVEFTATIWTRPDGTEISPSTKCRECAEKEQEAERQARLQTELEKAAREQRDTWLENSGIPGNFIGKTLENYDEKLQPVAFKRVKELQYNRSDESMPASLVLLSPTIYGVGKTHLVCALAQHIIEKEPAAYIRNGYVSRHKQPVYFTSENYLLRQIRNSYNNRDGEETEEDIYRRLNRFPVLIMDDVGKVRPRDKTFLQGVYFNIIDQRYCDQTCIVLTTNLDYSELEEHLGGACADRLREMCGKNGFVKMTGQSYRRPA